MRLKLATTIMVLLAGWLSGCGLPPKADLDSMCIRRLGAWETHYVATLRVTNPNEQDLMIEEIRWRLGSGRQQVTEGAETRRMELPARKVALISIYLTVTDEALNEAGLGDRRRFRYDFSGSVHISGPLGPSLVDFTNTGVMPVVHPLDVKLTGIERLGISDTRVGLSLTANVINNNDIALAPAELKGELWIDNRPMVLVETAIEQSVSIPPGGTAAFRIPLWVTSPEVGVRSLDRLITTPGTLFRLVGYVTFRMPGTGDVSDVMLTADSQADETPAVPR